MGDDELYFREPASAGRLRWTALGVGAGLTMGVFLLVAVTQITSTRRPKTQPVRSVERSSEPPPPPPREQPPPENAEATRAAAPRLERKRPAPQLEPLNLDLDPGTGGRLTDDLGDGFDFGRGMAGRVKELYAFDKLDRQPRILSRGRVPYPRDMARRGIEGYVELLVIIDRKGRVDVREVVDYSHRAFVEAAREMANKSRFSVPKRNGEPVRAKYTWRIEFDLGR